MALPGRYAAESGLLPGRRWNPLRAFAMTAGALIAVTLVSLAMVAINLERAPVQRQAQQPDPVADVKIVGAAPDTAKPCDQQTWPYIDKSCLSAGKGETGRADVADTTAQKPDERTVREPAAAEPSQPVGSMTAIAPTPPVSSMVQGTTGAASREPAATTETATGSASQRETQPSKPVPAASAAPRNEPQPIAPEKPPVHRSVSHDRRAPDGAQAATPAIPNAANDARKIRRSERKPAANSKRVVRRWTEYTYDTPGGRQERVIVIRRGSVNDDFFQAMR